MQSLDKFKYLVSGYYGVNTIDEYQNKVYILKDIENYIKDYVNEIFDEKINYMQIAQKVEKETPLKVLLQDSLLVLNEIDGPMEIVLLIKAKIKELK